MLPGCLAYEMLARWPALRTVPQPPPRGLPTVRAFQARQGKLTHRWLAQLL